MLDFIKALTNAALSRSISADSSIQGLMGFIQGCKEKRLVADETGLIERENALYICHSSNLLLRFLQEVNYYDRKP